MSEKLEALWLVMRGGAYESYAPFKVFRSRESARKFAAAKRAAKNNQKWWTVRRVTWGPE